MTANTALALAALAQRGADQGGISEGTALIIAGIGGAVLAAVLQTLGALLINYLASRREDRAAEREATKRREQWEREDKVRQDEQLEAAQRRNQTDRTQAYGKFAAATAFAIPLNEDKRAEALTKLTESHTEVQALGSTNVRSWASSLYDSAYRALYSEMDDDLVSARRSLNSSRRNFWNSISQELEDEEEE